MTIDINDLGSVVTFIDIMLSRGAIKGEEVVYVAAMRQKYQALVEAAQAQTKTEEIPKELLSE